MQRDPASFRDPAGHVYRDGDRILRTVATSAAPSYEHVRDSGALRTWIDRGWVVETKEVGAPADAGPDIREARYFLEHARVPFISYPYEWSFALLKAAALLHLDLQIDALNRDLQLSDASAFNVQFIGARPVFIDVLSFKRYQPGDYWAGHRQFCEQFLNPLLLRAALGIPHNAWLRGSPEGIPAAELGAALPLARKLSLNVFSHVTLPARLARKSVATPMAAPAARHPLPRSSYAGLLAQLRHWIAKLQPRDATPSVWRDYGDMRTYADDARDRKHAFVRNFMAATRPAMLWDLGCNTGEYAELALQAGAGYVVGFDADHGALDAASDRATSSDLRFLPLFMDAANPAPDQGWNQRERPGLQGRAGADALLALALVHHLAIARNVPLHAFAGWLTGLAPSGIVEFVPKEDPTVKLMLASRKDIFDGYTADAFEAAMASHARIVRAETISAAGRRLYQFERA
jgi:ribosomal protein L11 methylase PrmA